MSDIDLVKLRRLDFSLLLVFRETLRHGKASAAAERLGLSQPAVSHALARLRDLIGDPLFLRRPTGLQPTPMALLLAPKVEALLALADETIGSSKTFDPRSATRIFRISANDFAGSLLTAPLVADFTANAPAAKLSFRFAAGPAGFKALRENALDVMIGRFDSLPDDLVATTLFEDDYRVIARIGHPGLSSGLDMDAYLSLGHLVVSFTGDLTGTVDRHLRQAGRERRIAAGSPMFLAAFAAVSGTDLIATAPARMVRRFGPAFGLQDFPPPLPVDPIVMELVRSRIGQGDPAIDWLVARINAAFRQG